MPFDGISSTTRPESIPFCVRPGRIGEVKNHTYFQLTVTCTYMYMSDYGSYASLTLSWQYPGRNLESFDYKANALATELTSHLLFYYLQIQVHVFNMKIRSRWSQIKGVTLHRSNRSSSKYFMKISPTSPTTLTNVVFFARRPVLS